MRFDGFYDRFVFDDLFSKRESVYSGSEETEFYLSKLYAIAKHLDTNIRL